MKKRVLAIVAAVAVMMMGTLTVSAAGSSTSQKDSAHYAAPAIEGTATVSEADVADVAIANKAAVGTELWSADIKGVGAVTVTAPVAGVTEGETDLVVVHVKDDKSVEYLSYTTGNGTVKFTMTSYSPVVIYKLPAYDTTTAGAAATTATTTSAAVSAKTGEAMAVVLFAAIAFAGVAALCAKKSRA